MKDRIPVNPGRVLVTPENGSPFYATLTRADNPTQEGDPLNKNTLLKDTTAALFGLGVNAVPDDVLVKVKAFINDNTTLANTKAKIATWSYTGTGTYGESNPNSIAFDFAPKFIWLIACNKPEKVTASDMLLHNYASSWSRTTVYMDLVSTSYTKGAGFCYDPNNDSLSSYLYGKKSADGKTFYWYNTRDAYGQANLSSYIHYGIAFG